MCELDCLYDHYQNINVFCFDLSSFISSTSNGKVYVAQVKRRTDARKIYDTAKKQGKTAGLVATKSVQICFIPSLPGLVIGRIPVCSHPLKIAKGCFIYSSVLTQQTCCFGNECVDKNPPKNSHSFPDVSNNTSFFC